MEIWENLPWIVSCNKTSKYAFDCTRKVKVHWMEQVIWRRNQSHILEQIECYRYCPDWLAPSVYTDAAQRKVIGGKGEKGGGARKEVKRHRLIAANVSLRPLTSHIHNNKVDKNKLDLFSTLKTSSPSSLFAAQSLYLWTTLCVCSHLNLYFSFFQVLFFRK